MNPIEKILTEAEHFDSKDKFSIKNNGVVFTDRKTCSQIINHLSPKISDKICEPSVGKGIFVFCLLEYFRNNQHSIDEIIYFIEKNLFCYDINNSFIESLKDNLNYYVNYLGYDGELDLKNIKCQDYLLTSNFYDVTLGNPPYVRIQNISSQYMHSLKVELQSLKKGNVDLYFAFIEKSLIESKKIGFIVPNSFMKTKSGKNLREIIINRLKYVYDNLADKIWKKISTYTCILICEEGNNDYFDYETKQGIKKIKKENLNSTFWEFDQTKNTKQNLDEFYFSCSGGLATLKDKVYKVQSFDKKYCYIDNKPIEYGICKKFIKPTKNKTLNDFSWIIYPYDANGIPFSENYISQNFPLAYEYLLSNKNSLQERDKGKARLYKSWYAYGRNQGLIKSKKGVEVIIPITFLKSKGLRYFIVPENEKYLVISGITVDVKKNKLKKFIDLITSEKFYYFCEIKNKILKDKSDNDDLWLSLTTTTIKHFKF